MRLLPTLLLVLSLPAAASELPVQSQQPHPILPEQQKWFSPPPIPGLQATWMLGSEQDDTLYAQRVRLQQGTKIPPHTHPDTRSSIVLSGTLYVGFGAQFDAAAVVAIPAGAMYVAPANVTHYLWAKDGAVEYQENGVGPTATYLHPQH